MDRWSSTRSIETFFSEPDCLGVQGRNQEGLPASLPTSRNVRFCSAGKEKGFLPATVKVSNPPPAPGTASRTFVENQLAAPHTCRQPNNQTKRMVKKCSSPEGNANMTVSSPRLNVWRQTCFLMTPKRIHKTNRNMAATKGLRLLHQRFHFIVHLRFDSNSAMLRTCVLCDDNACVLSLLPLQPNIP